MSRTSLIERVLAPEIEAERQRVVAMERAERRASRRLDPRYSESACEVRVVGVVPAATFLDFANAANAAGGWVPAELVKELDLRAGAGLGEPSAQERTRLLESAEARADARELARRRQIDAEYERIDGHAPSPPLQHWYDPGPCPIGVYEDGWVRYGTGDSAAHWHPRHGGYVTNAVWESSTRRRGLASSRLRRMRGE